MLEEFDILPTSLSPTLRTMIYVIIAVHLIAFLSYLILLCKSWGKNEQSFSSYVD